MVDIFIDYNREQYSPGDTVRLSILIDQYQWYRRDCLLSLFQALYFISCHVKAQTFSISFQTSINGDCTVVVLFSSSKFKKRKPIISGDSSNLNSCSSISKEDLLNSNFGDWMGSRKMGRNTFER